MSIVFKKKLNSSDNIYYIRYSLPVVNPGQESLLIPLEIPSKSGELLSIGVSSNSTNFDIILTSNRDITSVNTLDNFLELTNINKKIRENYLKVYFTNTDNPSSQIEKITTVGDINSNLNGKYFIIPDDSTEYLVCITTEENFTPENIFRFGSVTLIVKIDENDSAEDIAFKIHEVISSRIPRFDFILVDDKIIVTREQYKYSESISDGDTNFTFEVTQHGITPEYAKYLYVKIVNTDNTNSTSNLLLDLVVKSI